jgi:hypothetical protein
MLVRGASWMLGNALDGGSDADLSARIRPDHRLGDVRKLEKLGGMYVRTRGLFTSLVLSLCHLQTSAYGVRCIFACLSDTLCDRPSWQCAMYYSRALLGKRLFDDNAVPRGAVGHRAGGGESAGLRFCLLHQASAPPCSRQVLPPSSGANHIDTPFPPSDTEETSIEHSVGAYTYISSVIRRLACILDFTPALSLHGSASVQWNQRTARLSPHGASRPAQNHYRCPGGCPANSPGVLEVPSQDIAIAVSFASSNYNVENTHC